MDVSILEWNINQRAGHRNILPWVLDEVVAKKPDIIVLTEFCTECEGGNKFIEDLEGRGYQCFTSNNPQGNDVMIAVKNHFHVGNDASVPCYGKGAEAPDSIPENLRVDIDCGGRTLTVVGIRIKAFDLKKKPLDEINELKRKEFLWALDWIKNIKNPIIIAGDFNNNRRGAETAFDREKLLSHQRWSIAQIDHMLPRGFMRITPSGSSIWEAAKRDPDYEFAEDHFIVKGIQGLTLSPYDRSFSKNDEEHYPAGEDFQWFEDGAGKAHCARSIDQLKEYKNKYGKPHHIDSGYPDHAILRGIFALKAPDGPADQ